MSQISQKENIPINYVPAPDMKDLSYSDIFNYFLGLVDKKSSDNIQVEIDNKKASSYTLVEDLKIILVSGSFEEVHNKDYKTFEAKVHGRSYQSIKDRYKHFLRYLTQEDFDRIVKFLQQNGPTGYLLFSNGQNKKLINIVNQDPKTSAMYQERRKFDEDQPVNKKVRLNSQKNQDEFIDEELEVIEIHDDKNQKKNIQAVPQDPTFPKNEYDRFGIEDMDQILTLIAQWKRVPKVVIVEKLHQLSGNLGDLDDYLMTMNEQYCWLEEEDMLLAKAESKHSPEIRLLIKSKTLERVKRRIKYLGFKIPFELE